jgi:hypothetical protein
MKFITLKIDYADGTRQKFHTEPMGRNMAKEVLLMVFYQQSGDIGGSQIVSAAFYPKGKGKPLHIHREAL